MILLYLVFIFSFSIVNLYMSFINLNILNIICSILDLIIFIWGYRSLINKDKLAGKLLKIT